VNYSIDYGQGNTISAGLPAHLARGCAQEAADRLGRSVWLRDGTEGEDEVGEEFEASDEITVEATVGTSSTCLGDGEVGYDFDVTVTIGTVTLEGSATLVPDGDPRNNGRLVSWGSLYHWLCAALAKVAVARADRTLEHAIEQACRAAGTDRS
jgi:hypothetical protein